MHATTIATTIATGVVLATALSSATALASADAAPSHQASPTHRAGSFRVTATVDNPQPLLDSKVKIKGVVRPAAPGSAVTLQVRYENRNGWKTIDSDRLNHASEFKFKQEIDTDRGRKYRVLKPADPGHAAGRSHPVELTAFAWRPLTAIHQNSGFGLSWGTATIGGVTYPSSLVAVNTGDPQSYVAGFDLDPGCTTVDARVGLDDRSAASGAATLEVKEGNASLYSGTFTTQQSAQVQVDVTGVFKLDFWASTANSGTGAFGSPRVLCPA